MEGGIHFVFDEYHRCRLFNDLCDRMMGSKMRTTCCDVNDLIDKGGEGLRCGAYVFRHLHNLYALSCSRGSC